MIISDMQFKSATQLKLMVVTVADNKIKNMHTTGHYHTTLKF